MRQPFPAKKTRHSRVDAVNRYCQLVRNHKDPRFALDHLVPNRLFSEVVYTLSVEGFKVPAP